VQPPTMLSGIVYISPPRLTMQIATFTLPILSLSDLDSDYRSTGMRLLPRPTALPRVEWIERHGTALHPSPIGPAGEVLALNLARGCWHRCGFCAARAYVSFPRDGILQVYCQTPQQLDEELRGGRRLPRAVFVSPATDPFPPSS